MKFTLRACRGLAAQQRGSGSLLVLCVAVFLMVGVAAFGVFGQYMVIAHRARAAADLAALAGAQAYGSGKDGCEAAERFAVRNDHRLDDCSIVGDKIDFVLTTKITAPVPIKAPVLPKSITVRAHAGPVR